MTSVRYLTTAGVIAAVYIVLCLVFRPISFGPIQCRIAEALVILPYFTPAAVPGLAVGCFLGNVVCGADIFDIIFGTLATLLGAAGSRLVRKKKFLTALPPVLSNTLIVSPVVTYVYSTGESFLVIAAGVFAGELIAAGILGTLLLILLDRYRNQIFKN